MAPDDPHRLAERRSVAYHAVIANRLACKPEILQRARRRVAEWCRSPSAPFHVREWERILSTPDEEICRFLVEDSDLARELRQSSPFAGVLSPRERWEIWHRVAGHSQ